MVRIKRLPASFYRSATDNEPVREWLHSLESADRRVIGQDIATAEFGWPVGMPVCRSLGRGLYEIRSDLANGRTARVVFCVASGRMVLLHGFIKKSQRTPKTDIDVALKRKKQVR